MNLGSEQEKQIITQLQSLFHRAVASVDPANCLPPFLPPVPKGRTLVVAAGKAAASMARATENAWPNDAPLSGIALTRYGHGMACERIEVIEAAHPVPDNRGYEAAQRIVSQVAELGRDDLLLFLVSGGGSALLSLPAPGISLEEKKQINRALLMSGAPIGEMNVVRKHLSSIKGGRLAKIAQPAQVVTLGISDVPFDDPGTIASGPTVSDTSTIKDTIKLLNQYQIDVPDRIEEHLATPGAETPKPGDPAFANTAFHMIAKPADMLDTVVRHCRESGHDVETLGADIEGEAREVARAHAALALKRRTNNRPGYILSGGETTVTVDAGKPTGKGGRNVEYLLALTIALNGASGVYALAADTDGIDGSQDNAGAIITPDTLARAHKKGIDPQAMLDGHDAYNFFKSLGDLVTTGPTRTNVNDFRAIAIT